MFSLKKLVNLVKNYDKIMVLIEDKPQTGKKYSTFNTTKDQMRYIANRKKKGE